MPSNFFERAAEIYKGMGLDIPDEKKKKLLDELMTLLEKSNYLSVGEKENIKKIMNFLPVESLEDLKNRLIEMQLTAIKLTQKKAATTETKPETKQETTKPIKNEKTYVTT